MNSQHEPSILCLRCMKRSYNLSDIEQKFCGNCGVFHQSPATYEIGASYDLRQKEIDRALRDNYHGEELEQARNAMKLFSAQFREPIKHAFENFERVDFDVIVVQSARIGMQLQERVRAFERETGRPFDVSRDTYTTTILELSPAAYEEIRKKLAAAGYDHAFVSDNTIDMHGLAIRPQRPADNEPKG